MLMIRDVVMRGASERAPLKRLGGVMGNSVPAHGQYNMLEVLCATYQLGLSSANSGLSRVKKCLRTATCELHELIRVHGYPRLTEANRT